MTDPLLAFARDCFGETEPRPEVAVADVEAKRKIVAAYEDALTTLRTAEQPGTVFDLMTGAVNSYRHVIRLLVEPYAERAGCLPEWKP